MGRRYETVSFLSDYGTTDEFVGVVHSVIRDLAPHARVIDLTHGVAPFDVRAGSLALARSIGYVASGVILAVVDPGVGTARRAIAVEVADGEGVLVGPDNGLLAPAVAMAGGAGRTVEITNPDHRLPAPGATFAGRDIFAPAAAYLCNGVDLTELGPEVDADLLMPGVVALPQSDDTRVIAQVLWVDRYGNAQLNVGPDDLPATFGERIELRCASPTDPTAAWCAARREPHRLPRWVVAPSASSSTRPGCSLSRWTNARRPTNSASPPVTRSRSCRPTTSSSPAPASRSACDRRGERR